MCGGGWEGGWHLSRDQSNHMTTAWHVPSQTKSTVLSLPPATSEPSSTPAPSALSAPTDTSAGGGCEKSRDMT